MNRKTPVLIAAWLPDEMLARLTVECPGCEFLDGREPAACERLLPAVEVAYGQPPLPLLPSAAALRWIQLTSAGVTRELCPLAQARGWTVTNLAGLYGGSIAEHALGLMVMLSRNLHTVMRNQLQRRWDRTVMRAMSDLQGKTVAIVGLGDIGRSVARLARAYGMQVLGCRRRERPTPDVDRLYPVAEVKAMLSEADYVVVTAPLIPQTEGMLGPDEFAAMKRGVVYICVSRGGVAQEAALLAALHSGHVAAAGLDVYAVEPLAADHPLWQLPQVVLSPHVSGEVINQSARPAERFLRNLHAWFRGQPLEGVVDLEWGY